MTLEKESTHNQQLNGSYLIHGTNGNGTVESAKMKSSGNPTPQNEVFPPPPKFSSSAHISTLEEYKNKHKKSVEFPEDFWKEITSEFYFKSPVPAQSPYFEYNFNIKDGPIYTKFMAGAKTNISYNLLDHNIQKYGLQDTVAFYWEGNEPSDTNSITYAELLARVNQFSNALKNLGIQKGDRVGIYLPMVFEVVIAMLACTRIGAVHSVVFAGFSAQSLSERMLDAKCVALITADGFWRGNKLIHLKEISDEALEKCKAQGHTIEHCIVLKHLHRVNSGNNGNTSGESPTKKKQFDQKINFSAPRDKWWSDLVEKESEICEPEWMDSEDPLFMLYTSGSTGKPKGVLHSTTGYMIYTATTFKYVFDYKQGDIYWCTADVGWITGHSYLVYGPLANGATSVMFEGTPFHPNESRFWEIVQKYRVNQFYTAPTAIRSLMKFGDGAVTKYDLSSLKILGTVGEPINPEAWLWYHNIVGGGNCPIVDTFWQTETGGHVITPLPGAIPLKPGSATFPFFGVEAAILTEEGKVIEGPGEGYLVFSRPWPSLMRTIYGDHSRFETTYFTKFPGYFLTGDGARRDGDGYIWITGRVDDMLNVSGHLLSTAQVESALIEHKAVAESAAVAAHHEVKGEIAYCFVTPKDGYEWTPELVAELKLKVRESIGAFATPEVIQLAPALPKTRSGKIMRRVLRKIAAGDSDFGDISTLADETVIKILVDLKPPTNN